MYSKLKRLINSLYTKKKEINNKEKVKVDILDKKSYDLLINMKFGGKEVAKGSLMIVGDGLKPVFDDYFENNRNH